MLLRKGLREAIREVESKPANDVYSLILRLALYRRAVNNAKIASTIRQIIALDSASTPRYEYVDRMRNALYDEHFADVETLQAFLKFDFNDDIYGKLVRLCTDDHQRCDIEGFDRWLESKAEEYAAQRAAQLAAQTHIVIGRERWEWIRRQIAWRKMSALDADEIIDRLADRLRNEPDNLDSALIYLQFARTIEEIEWIEATFASGQAYDLFELGQAVHRESGYIQQPGIDRVRMNRIAIRLLEKSLDTAFDEKDISLMYSRRLFMASVTPTIRNFEKQLRFWTRSALAEALIASGRTREAQLIAEELMSLDFSDIISTRPGMLAGTAQAASGARVIESKILREQAEREDSSEYWFERIAYYQGRKEPELVFDAYLRSFDAVPFNISNERSIEDRLHRISRFARFARSDYRYSLDEATSRDYQKREMIENRFTSEATRFLRREIETTQGNFRYLFELVEIIGNARFDHLLDEAIGRRSDLLIFAAKNDLLSSTSSSLRWFFSSETIDGEHKDRVFHQLCRIGEGKNVEKARLLLEALSRISEKPEYASRLIPILEKNLKVSESRARRTRSPEADAGKTAEMRNRYLGILFDSYLQNNNRAAAEKLLRGHPYLAETFRIDSLIFAARRNGEFDDVVRYWKMKADLDRRNLYQLSILRDIPSVADRLREFYKQMKIDEPDSPVPDIALGVLN